MSKKIAVYGSLKKGFYNHNRFNMGEPIARGKIRGAMFLMYSYPHLYRSGFCDKGLERSHEVEVYDVDDDTYNAIKRMEISAGYQEVPMTIDGHDCTVFYSRDDYDYKLNWIKEYSANTVPSAVV